MIHINGYWNEEMETLPQEQMRDLQFDRLKRQVRYAYDNVPMYRRRFDEANMSPDISRLEDIQDLPFTVKDDLRDHYPYGILARPMEELLGLQRA